MQCSSGRACSPPYLCICTRRGVSPGLVMKGTCTFGSRCGCWLSSLPTASSSASAAVAAAVAAAAAWLLTLVPIVSAACGLRRPAASACISRTAVSWNHPSVCVRYELAGHKCLLTWLPPAASFCLRCCCCRWCCWALVAASAAFVGSAKCCSAPKRAAIRAGWQKDSRQDGAIDAGSA